MDFGLYQKHEAFIKERWLPLSVEFMLQEGPEKKISFLKEAQRQASKEIQNIEEKSAFIKSLEIEIRNIQNELSKNGSTKAQMPVQRNETLNTGDRTIEGIKSDNKKIQWTGTKEELRSMFDLLYESGLLAESSDIPTLAQNHFYISGNKPIDRTNFAKVKRLKKDVSRETVEQFLECLREQEELK
jgi:hypothetical protein